MNRTQGAYLFGKVVVKNLDILSLAIAAKCGYDFAEQFITAQGFTGGNGAMGAINGMIAAYFGFYAFHYGKSRISLYTNNITDKIQYPLEHAERVFFDDEEGLDFLLEETAAYKSEEWGTLLKAHDDKGRAIIYDILDPAVCKQRGFIGEGTTNSLPITISAAENEYNGCHHYHPRFVPDWIGAGAMNWIEAMNFTISSVDKSQTENWINLLTFNLPQGPEIVGFNRQYTYIPADTSKRVLVKATPKQIMEYLQHF